MYLEYLCSLNAMQICQQEKWYIILMTNMSIDDYIDDDIDDRDDDGDDGKELAKCEAQPVKYLNSVTLQTKQETH